MNLDFTTQALLVKVDELEEQIKQADKITKEYTKLKDDLKMKMKGIAEDNNLDQVKWTTPKGTKITFTRGKKEVCEKQKVMTFKEDILKEKFPDIYNQCLVEEEKLVTLEKGTNNVLRITLNKEDEDV